jgi:Putative Actinobacterial Holin-X, holin superfamily III
MPTRAAENGVGAAAKRVADHAKALVGLELELASLEVKQKVTAIGIGAGLLVAAAVFAFFAVGFGLATVAAALATFLDVWLALLLTFAGLLFIAAVLVAAGLSQIRRGTPPVPEQAVHEAKLTTEALRSDGRT